MLERRQEIALPARPRGDDEQAVVDIGVLTRGKSSLGIALSSLLLQDTRSIRIHIVDTSESPVVNRDDVTLALRLAFDREIHCSYERLRERRRGFSLGRLRLLEVLRSKHVCFVDDDMALTAPVVRLLLAAAQHQGDYACISPACVNATVPLGGSTADSPYHPGSLFHLDDAVRDVLMRYYASTVDVVDAIRTNDKVWEVAFLGELFRQVDRPCVHEPRAVVYHLDYHELANWSLGDPAIMRRSVNLARQLVGREQRQPLAV